MRVRYGKPIRVKSLLSDCFSSNILTTGSSATIVLARSKSGGISLWGGINTGYGIYDIITGHKYAYFLKMSNLSPEATSSRRWALWDKTNNKYIDYPTTTKVDDIYLADWVSTLTTSVYNTFQINYSSAVAATMNPEYMIAIDLTEIGLDNLTAQEFYNKYHQYFHLIAIGEEITIDDKAGQVSLKEKNSNNTISCKVAGGSSDIYYGYNQLIRSGDFSDMSEWTSYNCNIETVEDGYIKLITTATNGRIVQYPNHGGYTLRTDHLYLIHLDVKDIDGKFSMAGFEYLELSIGTNYLIKHGNGNTFINIYGGYDRVRTYIIMKNLFIIDLTDWFGAGKEPTTAQEFYSMFTKSLYGECISPIKLTRYQIEALPNYGYNQLVEISNSKVTGSGVTKTINGTEVTFTASTVGGTRGQFSKISIVSNHKYLVSAYLTQSKTGNAQFCLFNSNFTSFADSGKIVLTANTQYLYQGILTATFDDTDGNLSIYQRYGEASSAISIGDNIKVDKTMLIDLTDWYGEGKEPTTVEEFKQTFPNKYYAYSKKRLLNKYMINKLEN